MLDDSKIALADEATSLMKLTEVSTRLWGKNTLREGLEEMLEATLELLGADMGYVRLLNGKGLLTIVAQRGFGEDIVDTFREIGIDDDVTCRKALDLGQRTVIEDIETDPFYSALRGVARAAGYRALQCTPLIARNGRALGMLSTHFRSVHRPLEEHFRRLD